MWSFALGCCTRELPEFGRSPSQLPFQMLVPRPLVPAEEAEGSLGDETGEGKMATRGGGPLQVAAPILDSGPSASWYPTR